MIEPIQIELTDVQYNADCATELVKISSGDFRGRTVGQWMYKDGLYSVSDNMGSNAFSSASIAAAMNWAVSLAYRQVAKTIDAMAEAK